MAFIGEPWPTNKTGILLSLIAVNPPNKFELIYPISILLCLNAKLPRFPGVLYRGVEND
jgi:hypothetical protein